MIITKNISYHQQQQQNYKKNKKTCILNSTPKTLMLLFFSAHRSHWNVRSVSIQLCPPRPPTHPFGKHRQTVNTHHRKCASAPHSVSLQSSSTVKMQLSEFWSTFIGEEHSERRKQVTHAPLWSWKPSLCCGGGQRNYARAVAAFFSWNSFIRLSSSGRKWRMRPCNKHTMMHRGIGCPVSRERKEKGSHLWAAMHHKRCNWQQWWWWFMMIIMMMICQCVEQSKDLWEKPCSWCMCRGSLFAKWLAKVCAHAPTHPHMYTYTHTHSHTPTHSHTHMYARTHTHPHTPTHPHTHPFTYTNTPIHARLHTPTHQPTPTYTCTSIHTHIHEHTLTHTTAHIHMRSMLFNLTHTHAQHAFQSHTYTRTAFFSVFWSYFRMLAAKSVSDFYIYIYIYIYKTHILFITWTGQAAPSPRAQMVCPSICLVSSYIMSISAGCALPEAVQQKAQRVTAMAKNNFCTEQSMFVQRRMKKACFCMEHSMSTQRRRTKQTYLCIKIQLTEHSG